MRKLVSFACRFLWETALPVHEALWKARCKKQVTPLFEDEWRNPVSVANVATLVKEALEIGGIKGLFHWAGADSLNRWEMGHRIANSFNVPEDLLQRTIARNYPQFKDRPLNLTMDSYKLKALVETEPEPFENQLKGLLIPNT